MHDLRKTETDAIKNLEELRKVVSTEMVSNTCLVILQEINTATCVGVRWRENVNFLLL